MDLILDIGCIMTLDAAIVTRSSRYNTFRQNEKKRVNTFRINNFYYYFKMENRHLKNEGFN